MSGKKITDLPELSTVDDSGYMAIVSAGVTYKISVANLLAGLSSGSGSGSGSGSSSSTPTLLLDSFSDVATAFSLRQLRGAFTGSAITVQLASGSTNGIGFNSGYTLDTAALSTFVGSSSAYVKSFHDQMAGSTSQNTGGAYDVSQSTLANMPQIASVNGLETLVFSGSQQLSGLANPGSPFTVMAVCRITGNSAGAFVKLGGNSSGVGVGIGAGNWDGSGSNFIGLNEIISWYNTAIALPVGVPFVVEFNGTSDNSTHFLLNGLLAATGGSYIEPAGNIYFGSDQTNRQPTFDLYEVITFNDVISAPTRAAILASMWQAYCEVLLIQCSSINSLTGSVYDASNQYNNTSITNIGSPVLSSTTQLFGGATLYLNGSSAIRVANAMSWNPLNFVSDFTWELWIYLTSLSGTRNIFINQSGASGLSVFSDGSLDFWIDGTAGTIARGGSISLSTWHFITATRANGIITLYIDGNSVGSGSASNALNMNNGCFGAGTYNNNFTGNISNIRLSNGAARYSANFTSPTASFTA